MIIGMMQSMLEIFPIPAFSDNYIWLIKRGKQAAVVDPGDAIPVMETLNRLALTLDTILITHHHSDHIGGVAALLQHSPAHVYAPKHGHYDFRHQGVEEGDIIHLQGFDLDLTVMELPGHTLDHVAYYGADSVFCGDTLFAAGCGRLFEGTPAQMFFIATALGAHARRYADLLHSRIHRAQYLLCPLIGPAEPAAGATPN